MISRQGKKDYAYYKTVDLSDSGRVLFYPISSPIDQQLWHHITPQVLALKKEK